MARSGLAKGANKGHITEQRERAPRPSRSKGVSRTLYCYNGERKLARSETLRRHFGGGCVRREAAGIRRTSLARFEVVRRTLSTNIWHVK